MAPHSLRAGPSFGGGKPHQALLSVHRRYSLPPHCLAAGPWCHADLLNQKLQCNKVSRALTHECHLRSAGLYHMSSSPRCQNHLCSLLLPLPSQAGPHQNGGGHVQVEDGPPGDSLYLHHSPKPLSRKEEKSAWNNRVRYLQTPDLMISEAPFRATSQ